MSTSSQIQEDEVFQYDDVPVVEVDSEVEEDSSPPAPKFAVFEKVYAKDNTTPLLYEAVVRKMVYAPLSKKMNVYLVDKLEEALDDALAAIMDEESVYSWHYFVHYQGWAPRFDRWVDEHQLFKEGKDTEALAKRLKEASKSLKKGSSAKKVTEVMQGLVRLEQELREKQAKGETIDTLPSKVETVVTKVETKKSKEQVKQEADSSTKNQIFIERERKLRKLSQCSKKASITLPFSIKKVLTEDWEIISQCDMVHNIPSSKTVMNALNHYLELKLNMIRSSSNHTAVMYDDEEKKEKESADCDASDNHENISSSEQEWIDMVNGIAMYFDQSLPKRLLYKQEIPQCILLEQNFEKRYCELYPCEHLVRMCMKIPDQLAESSQLEEEEKSKIIFKIGDLIRFLQKNQGTYLLQRYRNKTPEENVKTEKMKKQLGLSPTKDNEEENGVIGANENLVDEQVEDVSRWKNNKGNTVAKASKQVSRKRKKIL